MFRLARYRNTLSPVIPERVITRPPSAELAPDQKDSDSLPDYGVLDEIVDRHVERKQSAATIARETGFGADEVARICRLIDRNEYKRRQMATGLNAPGQSLVATLRQRLVRHWPDLLLRHWQAMAPELLVSVLEDLPADGQLEPLDQRDLQGFAHGHRGYDLCWPVLRALSRCPGVLARVRDQGELPLWVAAVLRGRDWQALRQVSSGVSTLG